MHRFSSLLVVLSALVPRADSVETRTWQQSERADFEKGNLKRLSLRSDGRLSLAPVFQEVFDSSVPYLWALAEDSKGNLYAGGGGPNTSAAKLFVIDPAGKSKVLAELDGMEIHAIAVDSADRVYAATSPDGKIYRIPRSGKPHVFYDPKAKYIWEMAFNSKGELFVATGDQGEIHRVATDGKGAVFFKTEETHARSIAVDAQDNLIVGTEPGGLILRVSPAGEGFVLYQAGKREITAVAVAASGAIYAAGVGNKQTSPLPAPPPPPAPATPAPAPGTVGTPGVVVQRPSTTPPPPTMGPGATTVIGGSEVYRIDPDGFQRKVWSDAQEIAYAIGFDDQGRPLIGTGNKGNVYRLDSELLSTLLVNTSPTQVTGFSSGRQGRLYAVTGNIGKVYRIGPGIEKDGWFESEVLDATFFSYWGHFAFHGNAAGGKIAFETRSGNLDRPQKNWSPWAPIAPQRDGGRIGSPSARFLQWKATLAAQSGGPSPVLNSVEIAYLPKNVPPVVEQIEITPANYRTPQQSLSLTPSQTLMLPPLGQRKRSSSPSPAADSASLTLNYAKGYIGARWLAKDDNGDSLVYTVEIRGTQESEWKLLKDKVREKYLSWDSTSFPDGEYRLRVTASDSPSNPPAQAQTNQLESDPFLIDNTPPQILGLAATASGGKVTVTWKARDARSVIDKAEYSLDGGEWLLVEPATMLSDSRELDYNLALDKVAPGEHTIAVRVTDECDNQALEKVVVR